MGKLVNSSDIPTIAINIPTATPAPRAQISLITLIGLLKILLIA